MTLLAAALSPSPRYQTGACAVANDPQQVIPLHPRPPYGALFDTAQA